MKSVKIWILYLTTVILGTACMSQDSDPQTGATVGEFIGREELSKSIRNRMLIKDRDAYKFKVHTTVSFNLTSISDILGSIDTQGEIQNYIHGKPTPLAVLFWGKILGNFAQNIAGHCSGFQSGDGAVTMMQYDGEFDFFEPDPKPVNLTLKPAVVDYLGSICQGESRDYSGLFDLLLPNTSEYDGELKAEWMDTFFANDQWKTAPEEHLSEVLLGTFMNPYFLLRYQ